VEGVLGGIVRGHFLKNLSKRIRHNWSAGVALSLSLIPSWLGEGGKEGRREKGEPLP